MAVLGSGMRIMSDSLMPFQPAIEDPSEHLSFDEGLSLTWW
jgi:hypothetical protein